MTTTCSLLAQFPSMPGGGEWLIIAFIGLLLFGKRLPEVGKSLGRGIVEFKKGLRGIEDHIEEAVTRPSPEDVPPPPTESQEPTPIADDIPTEVEAPAEKTEVHADPQ